MRKQFLLFLFFLLFKFACFGQLWDSIYPPTNFAPHVIFADSIDGNLYTGGTFRYIGGLTVNGIARWNGVTWDTLGSGCFVFSGNSVNGVAAITRFNNKIYAGGIFTEMGGVPGTKCLAEWDGITWHAIANVDGVIGYLTVVGNELYATGSFDSISGVTTNSIAKWNGTSWSGFPNLGDVFGAIGPVASFQGNIYIGGNFDGGVNKKDIAMFDGTNWVPVGTGFSGFNSSIGSLVVYKSEIYVAGYFKISDGDPANFIVRWDGTQWKDVGGGLNNFVHKLIVHEDYLWAVGVFTEAGGIPAEYIARWDGTDWCSIDADFDNIITCITVMDDSIYISGGFNTLNGDTMQYFAKWKGGSLADTCGNTTGMLANEIAGSEIFLYPNPTSGKFTISSSEKIESIVINNVLGEKIFQSSVFLSEIDLSKQPSGIYFLNASIKDKTISRKILKH